MDFTNVPDDLVLRHMNTLQSMLIQVVRDFPHTGNYDNDVSEMKEYICKWEAEANRRHLPYKGIDEKLQELNNV